MKSDKNPPQYAALTEKEMDFIDLGETLPYDKKGLSKDAKKILKKKLDFRSGQCELEEVSNGVAWTDFGNDFSYRYHFRFGTYYLSAIALLLVLIGLSYKNTRIVYEVFVSRILVTLKSVDMSGSKKTVRVLECIRDGYYALCFTAITLKSYFMFTSYLNAQTGINAILKAVILLFVAWCVIDGADVMEKITGVDAGISGGLGKMLAAYHVARGGANMVRGGFNTAMQMKQYHMMKEQTKAMKQAAGNVSGAGNGASEYGMKEMDQMLSKDGEANEGQQKHTSENETDIRQEQNSSYESRGMEEQQTNMKSEATGRCTVRTADKRTDVPAGRNPCNRNGTDRWTESRNGRNGKPGGRTYRTQRAGRQKYGNSTGSGRPGSGTGWNRGQKAWTD